MPERLIAVRLDNDTKLVVVAKQFGPALVADNDIVGKLAARILGDAGHPMEIARATTRR